MIKLGFKEKEVIIYLSLIENGEASTSEISKNTGLNPRTVYDNINSLIKHGLISIIKEENTTRYSASNPDRLISIEEEKIKNAIELTNQLKKVEKNKKEPIIKIFKGINGIKTIFSDKLSEKKTIYWYGGSMQGALIYLKDYYKIWNSKRLKLKIPIKMIYVDKPETKAFVKAQKLFTGKNIPEENYTNVVWWLYGNKMILTFWRKDPLAIMIEDQELTKTYKNFFEILWKRQI